MWEEGNYARMVVFVEDTSVDLGATFSHGIVYGQQGCKTLPQGKSYDGTTFVIGAQRQMQLGKGALQGTDDERLGVG